MNPPRQPSTCRPTPRSSARSDSAADRVDGAVAVVAGGADERPRSSSSMWSATRSTSTSVRLRIDRGDREPRCRRGGSALSNAGWAGLGLHDVGPVDAALLPAPARGRRAWRAGCCRCRRWSRAQRARCRSTASAWRRSSVMAMISPSNFVGARAHVALQRVDVGEQAERLVHERRSGRGRRSTSCRSTRPSSQNASSSVGHRVELGEDLLPRTTVLGQLPVDGEPVLVGESAHGAASLVSGRDEGAGRGELAHCLGVR